MRKILYTQPDGTVAVVTPTRNTIGGDWREELYGVTLQDGSKQSRSRFIELTDAEIEQRAWDKLPADAISPRFADARELPADRAFRDAWVDTGAAIEHDLEKAKDLTKERLRTESASLIALNDVALRDALLAQDGQKIAAATTERDRLRDVTKLADAASSLDALKALTAGKV